MSAIRPDTRKRAIAVACLRLAALVLFASRPAAAGVRLVTSPGDDGGAGQLRTIVAAAIDGDVILVPASTITLALGEIPISEDLTIVGAGRDLTVLDGAGASRVLNVTAGSVVVVSGVTVRNGWQASGTGGGIENFGTLTLVDVSVEDCRSEGGGGVSNRAGGALTLQSATVRRNSTTGLSSLGGGVLNGGTMTIQESTISGNAASGGSSSANGGGIGNAGTMTIVNSTISGNVAAGASGGGIHHTPYADALALTNVTITDNRSSGYGGGLSLHGGHVAVVNTIIAGNRGGTGTRSPDCSAGPMASGALALDVFDYNLLGNSDRCLLPAGAVGNVLDMNARLAALADNGGPTETHALLPSSPAVDAASPAACPLTDQRGHVRPIDGNRDDVAVCDMGAHEREGR